MSLESQKSISDWADSTFGPVTSLEAAAQRAGKEMREFQFMIDNWKRVKPQLLIQEMADIVISLYRLSSAMKEDLGRAIDKKMSVNRLRRWEPDGLGNGQHVDG